MRCVRGGFQLYAGTDYTIDEVWCHGEWVKLRETDGGWLADRFKPVVRVKAVCVPSLDLMVRRANAAFAKLSPEQQTVHWEMQRRSWVRGEMALGADR